MADYDLILRLKDVDVPPEKVRQLGQRVADQLDLNISDFKVEFVDLKELAS